MSTSSLIAILAVYLIYWVIFGRRHPQGIWICFWRALGLAFITFSGIIIGLFEVYRFLILYLLCLALDAPGANIFLLDTIIFLLASFIVYLIILKLYSLGLKLLWSNPPKFLRFRNRKSIFLGFLISAVASFPASITYAPFLAAIPKQELIVDALMDKGYEAYDIMSGMFFIWFLFAVGCYHAEYKFNKFRAYKSKIK